MRSRTSNSTTPPAPANNRPTGDPRKVGWTITEKGLLACGATNMLETAASLRQLADRLERDAARLHPPPRKRRNKADRAMPVKVRYGTVCGRYREHSKNRVPDLRLSGLWLEGAGFDLGQKYEVCIENQRLVVSARGSK